jgi:hypothetical protein
MQAIVHAADIQDRDGGVLLMASLFGLYPFLLKLYADGGYQGPRFQDGLARVLSCCQNAGSSNAPSPGSTAAEGWQRIGSASTVMPSPSCAGRQSG